MNYNNILIYFLSFIILWSIPASNGHGTSQPSSSNAASKQLNDHARFLVREICSLHQKKRFSDVVLVVNEERIPAHRFILALSSNYFSKLFYESDDDDRKTYKSDVKINEGPAHLFKKLLNFMYTGEIQTSFSKDKEIFELIKIAEYYGVSNFKSKLHIHLQNIMDYNNVFSLFAMARLYQFEALEDKTLNYIENNFLGVTQSGDFPTLSAEDLLDIINRDSFYVEEICIFRAVCLWISVNEHQLDYNTILKILSAVRYPVMSDIELIEAKESQLVSPDIILEAIQIRNSQSDKPQLRGQLKPDECMLRYIHHDHGINMVMLQKPSFINYIEISLWFGVGDYPDELKSYSYYIEVSTNGQHWTRVIDRSHYNCRSHQQLWIHPQVVLYVKVTGTNDTANATFVVWDAQYNAMHMHNIEINNGFVVPKGTYNVASDTNFAIVIRGENSVIDKSLLKNLNYKNEIKYDVYTYHLLRPKSDSIVIHLAQPYILSSMRLLLWGFGVQAYSYYIEVSLDSRHWVKIVDKYHEMAQSWQELQFESRLILYIRITGVSNSVGNDFRCVYLEAPSRGTSHSNYVLVGNDETAIMMT